MKWGIKKKAESTDKPLPQKQLSKLSQSGQFYGVKIQRSSCTACSNLAGKVFPFEDAPLLPLKDCDAVNCTCEYLGVVDPRKTPERRSGNDRRIDIRMSTERRYGQDRRSKVDNWIGYDF
ncbi:MAG: hypothetical protein QNJ78_10685 [Gammaproteobacteria bacterium]|nr:hypothetical protein [Gammaproteobacteria bacterium]